MSIYDLQKIINDCQVYIQLISDNDCAGDMTKEVAKLKKQVKDLSCFSLNIKGRDLAERLKAVEYISSRLLDIYHDIIITD